MHECTGSPKLRGLAFGLWLVVLVLTVLATQPGSGPAGAAPAEVPPPLPFPQPDTWVAGETSVSGWSDEEKQRLCGLSLEGLQVELRQAQASAPPALAAYDYPPVVDWRDKDGQDWTTPIRNQSSCGSCVAFGTIGAIEARMEIDLGAPQLNPDLSEAHLFFCGCGQCCSGGWSGTPAMDFALWTGIVDEACYPYRAQNQPCSPCDGWQDRVTKIRSYHGLASDAQTKHAIAHLGPVQAFLSVYEDFYYYKSGIYRHVWGDYRDGHCVTLVGYNDLEGYWIAKNSWGTGWGEDGWFRIAYGQAGIQGYYQPMLDCNDPFEANDSAGAATSIQVGPHYQADICPAGDTDYYAFAGSSGDRMAVRVDTASLGSVLDPILSLYDTDGQTLLAEKGGHEGVDPWIQYTLPDDGTYYVAVRAADHPQSGSAEHSYRLSVQPAPDIAIAPPSVMGTVDLGHAGAATLVISNQGMGALDFEMGELDGGFVPSGSQERYRLHQAGQPRIVADRKETSAEPASPEALPRASGGPDPFGYRFRDSTEVGGPTYRWIEIAPPAGGSGTEITDLTGVDDGYFWPLLLPFRFSFYGTGYRQMAIGSNGTLYFEDGYLGLRNAPIPAANNQGPERFIAPLWDDLVISPGAIYYQDLGTMLVIEYHQVGQVGEYYNAGYGSWEVILFANGNILFQYQDLSLGGDADYGARATIGIQGDAATGLQYAYNSPALSDGLAVCFAYPGQRPDCDWDVPWLSHSIPWGQVPPQETLTVTLTLDASVPEVWQPGTYHASLLIQSNDPDTAELRVPVTMTVPPPPTWGRLAGTVTSLGHCDGQPSPLPGADLYVAGKLQAGWRLATDSDGTYTLWLDETHNPLSLLALHPEHETALISDVHVAPLQTTRQDLALRWLQPCLQISPAALEESVLAGSPASRNLTLSNTGAAAAAFSLLEGKRPCGGGTLQIVVEPAERGGQNVTADLTGARTGSGSPTGQPPGRGGPDAFGYTFKDSTARGGPLYDWIEIAPPAGGSGILVPFEVEYYWPLQLPFSFEFYGSEYDQIAVSHKGLIWFEDRYLGGEPRPIPAAKDDGVGRFIAPLWDQLLQGNRVYYQDLGSRFVIQWEGSPVLARSPAGSVQDIDATWQVILFEDGQILFQYQDVAALRGEDFGPQAAVGIQGDTTTGLQYSYKSLALFDGLAIRFSHTDVPWLSEDPLQGSVPPGGSETVTVTLDSAVPEASEAGRYCADLFVWSNDPGQPEVQVPVTLTVTFSGLQIEPPAAARSGAPGSVVRYDLRVTNTGIISDTFDLAVSGYTWATNAPPTVGPLTAAAGVGIEMTVEIPDSAAGGATDTAVVVVRSQTDHDQVATTILTTTAEIPYGVGLAPERDARAGPPGSSAIYTLLVTNTGTFSDTFDVTIGGHTWPTTAPGPIEALAPGEDTTLTVTVQIPPGAESGAVDTATVTVLSQGDERQSARSVLTTTVQPLRIHLPLVLKMAGGR